MSILPVFCVGLFVVGALGTATNCSLNEEPHFCVNALCRSQKCEEQGILLPCPGVSQCIEGCVCVLGTLRNEVGKCIPENECPGAKPCPKNEQWSVCPESICSPKYCATRNESECLYISHEDDQCNKACVCAFGYLRNDKGECVAEEEC